jgi:XTP/dITP diphosphohydrolase
VAALGGAPGVFSARWAGPGRDFTAAMGRIEREMGAAGDRRAWFSCALCLAWPDGASETFLGRAEGRVVFPPRGESGFGYDPIFVPLGETRTYAEMSGAEKDAISHRGRALAQLRAACFGDG